jgi:small subunit ribosomal protein S2
MADVTAESPVSTETGIPTPITMSHAAAAGADASSNLAQMAPAEVTIRDLMEAGVHFGHQTRRWNPSMKPYLFGDRNGVHIINLDITLPRFRKGLDFVRDVVAAGGKVLFVSTKRQAREPIKLHAERSNQYFVNSRWLGGMLTNFKTVKKSIDRYKSMLEVLGDEEKSAELSKKELARVNRQVDKYQKSLDGIRGMNRLPQALFIIDVSSESIAVSEASRLAIPIVAVVDSNCNPKDIDIMVPGNDDSIRAIELYCSRVANACLEGEAIYNDRMQANVAETEKSPAKTEKARARTGRVVVEIKHPPRRGRGAAMAAKKRETVVEEVVAAKPEEQPAAENAEPKEDS